LWVGSCAQWHYVYHCHSIFFWETKRDDHYSSLPTAQTSPSHLLLILGTIQKNLRWLRAM
jgi:hypothetical protein